MHGLIVRNKDQKIQIDSTYLNYKLHEYDHVNIREDEKYRQVYFEHYEGKAPIVAVRPRSNYLANGHVYMDHMSAYFLLEHPEDAVKEPDVHYCVFREIKEHDLPGHGLVVRNNDNEVVFSSGEKYLKIINTYSGSINWDDYDSPPNEHNVQDYDSNFFILMPYNHYVRRVPGEYMYDDGEYPLHHVGFMGMRHGGGNTIEVGVFENEVDRLMFEDRTFTRPWRQNYKLIEVTF